MMGRGNNIENNNNNTTILYSSSIALLQERFRQLQKVKEMREERELRRASTVAASTAAAAAGGERQPGWFFHPDLVQPLRPSDGPMYRGLSSTDDDRAEFSALETSSLPVGFRPTKPAHAVSSHDLRNCTGKDVDTSLHL
ncbi:uncharacterized protein LOC109721137 [Ananas comosus]|uniref:Uncharacterized protein LOC109721137 n=1 Tax=Ananas comosus TaxID=4615 RepID=A0A199W1J1_ANACO|nr:uncharacterized protein LOC109721137 [Ananas comosus]OAY83149.1 hypothetical protein ACMD2_20050 [Ananas comosus]